MQLVEKLRAEKDASLNLAEYEELLYTRDPTLVAFIRSILDGAGITYIFQGDVAAYIPLLVPARLFKQKLPCPVL